MMIADSDVLIDFLRDRDPWAGRIELELKTGHLATTTINSFELLIRERLAAIIATVEYEQAQFRLFVTLGNPPAVALPAAGALQ